MYFFDAQDFAFPKGSATGSMQIFWRDTWYSHYYMRDFVFVNNPDGTLGVYYDANEFTGSTKNIQNFTSQITEEYCNVLNAKFDEVRTDLKNAFYNGLYLLPECYRYGVPYTCASERFATFFQTYGLYPNIPNCYWDTTRNVCATRNFPMLNNGENKSYADKCCGDDSKIDFDALTTEPISNAKTNEQFDLMMNTELVDAKTRKVISAYPTLRALYDRYMNSNYYTGVQSSAYDYEKMELVTKKIGNNWLDVVEQLVPSTSIWGVVKVYGNTVFDQQKYQYRSGNLLTCIDGFNDSSNTSLNFLNDCIFNQIEKFYSTCGGECESGDCNDEITTITRFDIMDDIRSMPTSSELDSWGSSDNICNSCNYSSLQSVIDSYVDYPSDLFDYQEDIRDLYGSFSITANTFQREMNIGYCYDEIATELNLEGTAAGPNLDSWKKMTLPTSPRFNQPHTWPWNFFEKGVTKKTHTYYPPKISLDTWWYNEPQGAILSAYTDQLIIRKAVSSPAELPLVGQVGDIIYDASSIYDEYYLWDPTTSSWVLAIDYEDYATTYRANRDAWLKAWNEFVLASKPFTWSSNYMLLHPFKKWAMQNATPVTGKQIIETNGKCLPCDYTRTVDCEVTNDLCLTKRNQYSEFDCDDDTIPPYLDAIGLDFMDSLNFMPTGTEIELMNNTGTSCNYTSLTTMAPRLYSSNFEIESYRLNMFRDDLWTKIDEVVDGMYSGFKKSDFPPINYELNADAQKTVAVSGGYYKGKMRRIRHTWWSKASAYTEWNTVSYPTHGVPLSTLLSGVGDFKYLSAVPNTSSLPTTASKGDLICVGTPTSHVGYAWDPILNSWSTNLYDFIGGTIGPIRRKQKNDAIKAKRNMLRAIKPFLWSNEYIISDAVRNWQLSNVSGYTVQRITDVIASNGSSLPPKYTMTASTHTLSGFTATTIIY